MRSPSEASGRPQNVLRREDGAKGRELEMQAEYESLDLADVDDEKAAMLICDAPLLSDEAVLFFLPAILKQDGAVASGADMLRSRLEAVELDALNNERRTQVAQAIQLLSQIEN